MGRERREFKRPTFIRDLNKLYVIATEGQKTEIQYFNGIKASKDLLRTKIYIEVLHRKNTNSSPTSVIKMLDDFKKEFLLNDDDELWLVIDRDKQSWGIDEISEIARLSIQKKYFLALSNPAFELWLLLHVKDIMEYSNDDLKELFENKRINKHRTRLEKELKSLCGSYKKSHLNLNHFLPHVRLAIKRAENLIKDPNERWPNYLGTHVHKLVKKILKAE